MPSNSPTITTIIPTYRRPERLRKAIQSVLNQTYPHFQICIYDNASGDETRDVVAAFSKDSRIKYYCHDTNIGSSANYQFGLSQVKTPYYSFLADDDYLLPNFYEETLKGFKKFPQALFSMGAVLDVDDRGNTIDLVLSRWPDRPFYSPPDGLLEMIGKYSNWTGTLFRKEIIEKIGQLDLKLKAIDVDFLFRAAAQCSFTVSKTSVAVFVQHPGSYSGVHGLKVIFPGWPMMMEKMKGLQPGDLVQGLLQRDFHNLLMMNGVRSVAGKKFDEAGHILALMKQEKANPSRILLLAVSIQMCQALPIVHRLLLVLLKLRRKVRNFGK